MITEDSIRTNTHIDAPTAARLTELWNASYPHMRKILTDVIRANRAAESPLVDVPRLEGVRRDLGQVDRGTYRPCTHGAPLFSSLSVLGLVRDVVAVLPLGSTHAGGVYRLAAALSDSVQSPKASL
ncbi:hypothetical protein [Streptomyces sp. TS71-3]|uniref:hypothetical protein n=1 Tax=Streptomyces sp. TS71-3 TaxID=2733862 RepID=UPI001B10B065|nr:hypothetical protein [Streptomyces sp. TS71-3]GHJ39486.1 hypothetical protein Sm713_50950 [Streptomyces sp. TS71-3]